jgi:hypothetical protein
MTRQGWVVVVGSLLIAIALIAAAVFYSNNPDAWPLSVFTKEEAKSKGEIGKGASKEVLTDDTDKFVNDAAKSIFEENELEESEVVPVLVPINDYSYDATGKTGYASWTQEVKIGLIIAKNEYDVKNVISGRCGDVYMVTYFVPGPDVLSNSAKALFGDKVFADFLPGNIIPSYNPNLKFTSVAIENGVAKIYLDGHFGGVRKGLCDVELAIAQLAETAKSHPSVKSVRIYQDDEEVYSSN